MSAAAIALSTLSFVANPAYTAETTTIELGQVGLSFYAVTGGVVQELLERDGYAVEVTEGSHSDIFPMLGEGEVDILSLNIHAKRREFF
ncbi:MAG: glycine betaine ABC transporter substrate-binding protein [Cyanobacteria bacterium J06642_11]